MKNDSDTDKLRSRKHEEAAVSTADELVALPAAGLETIGDFLIWYDRVIEEINENTNFTAKRYLQQLVAISQESSNILDQLDQAKGGLRTLSEEYAFVADKTKALNTASEQLIEEQSRLQRIADDIQQKLYYFNQFEILSQRLYSPTMSVSSDAFRDCLTKIDNCLLYLKEHVSILTIIRNKSNIAI